jgi:hypothetical protein
MVFYVTISKDGYLKVSTFINQFLETDTYNDHLY